MKIRLQTSIKGQPLTTAIQVRASVFLPVKEVPRAHPDMTIVVMENQWGKVTLKRCRLTQTHANLRDAILANAELIRKAPDGRIAVLYSPGKVLREMRNKGKNHAWLYRKLEEMAVTLIEVETPNFKATGPMVNRILESKVGMGCRIPGKDGKKIEPHFQLVIFDPFISYLFDVDVGLHYKDLLPVIFDLKHAVTQALVRFCLSHDQVNMALIDLLTALGAVNNGTYARTRQRVMKQIRNEAEVLERDFGITIRNMEDGREGVFYKKHPKVRFESPKALPEPVLTEIDVGEPSQTVKRHGLVPKPKKSDMV